MLRERAISATVFVPPLLVFVALGEPWFAGLVALFVLIAAAEAARLLRGASFPAISAVAVAGALAVAADVAAPSQLRPYAGLPTACVVVVAAIVAFVERDPRVGFSAWLATVFGALYVGQLGFLVRLGDVAPALRSDAPLVQLGAQRGWILLVILLVWSFDTAAYFVGRALGRRKFLAHISPSKSYWGVAGGLVASTAVAVAGSYALGQPPVAGLLLGPLVGLAAQAGDLAESMLKRAAGAKDSGGIIPGHGGILDRTDSFLFAAPLATLYVVAVVR